MNMEDDERTKLLDGLSQSQLMDVARACNRFPCISLEYKAGVRLSVFAPALSASSGAAGRPGRRPQRGASASQAGSGGVRAACASHSPHSPHSGCSALASRHGRLGRTQLPARPAGRPAGRQALGPAK